MLMVCWFVEFCRKFDLVKRVKLGFRVQPGARMERMADILHADVSWAPSELINLSPWSVNFTHFGATLT